MTPQPELIPSDPPLGTADRGAQRDRKDKPKRNAPKHRAPTKQPKGTPPAAPAPQAPPATAVDQTTIVEGAASAPAPPAPAVKPPPGIPRFHVVRRGDSLWAIASKLLGPLASDADIAREVSRLWRLNEQRIGTGDPNLLIAGVKLRLR